MLAWDSSNANIEPSGGMNVIHNAGRCRFETLILMSLLPVAFVTVLSAALSVGITRIGLF